MNQELCKLYDWLTANKSTLNVKKINFVIFSPAQRKLTHLPKIKIFDNEQNTSVALECKEFVKYLGILIDNNLSWKHHIDHIVIKISRTKSLISKTFCSKTHIYKYLSISYCTLLKLWFDSLGPSI